MMQSRFFSISLWASLAVLAALSGLAANWPVNHWSVAYWGQRISPQLDAVALSAPPENHPHANVWLAEDALARGDVGEAISRLPPQQKDINPFAIRLWAQVYVNTDQPTKAVLTLEKLSDVNSLIKLAAYFRDHNQIAQAMYFLADDELSSFMTGQALIVDGGATARLSTE